MKVFSFLRAILPVLLSIITTLSVAQTSEQRAKVRLYGRIINNWTGEGINGVSVYVESLKRGTSTDDQGNYSLPMEKGTYTVRYSRVGLKTEQRLIDLVKDVQMNVT